MKKNSKRRFETWKRLFAVLLACAMLFTNVTGTITASESLEPSGLTQEQDSEAQEPAAEESVAEDAAAEETPAQEPAQEETSEDGQTVEDPSAAESEQVFDSEAKTEETEQTFEETTPMPETSFEAYSNKVFVKVYAPEGAFPEGTTMKLTPVASEEVMDAVENAVEGTVEKVHAVDITFYNVDGVAIEPQTAINVSLSAIDIADQNATIVHLPDEAAPEVIDDYSVEKDGVTFESDAFSVYVVVKTGEDARLTVNFVQADGNTKTMMINERQIPQINQYIYDPGFGTLGEGVQFGGWTDVQNYTSDTEGLTIADVREKVIEKLKAGVTDGDEVTYYAMAFKTHSVVYYDEKSISLKTDQIQIPQTSTEAQTYEVNLAYTPYPTGEEGVVAEFVGWQQIKPEVSGTEVLYNNGDTFDLNETTYILKAKTQKGHWLTFEENLSNASYTEPQFIALGGTATKPENPTRTGYTFDGWYTADASDARDGQVSGDEFTFGQALDKNTTVYAKWTAAAKADYNVVFWFQKVEGEGYDYSGTTVTVSNANVGENTFTVSAQGSGNNSYARVYTSASNYTNYNNFTGFHLSSIDSAKKVAAEGTTVINVYYDRNMITYNFAGQTFTGRYGSAFTEWPNAGSNYVWQCTANDMLLPLPLTEFNPDAIVPGTSATTFTFRRTSYSSESTLYVYKQTETGSWSYTTPYLIAEANLGSGGVWYPTETYTGFTIDGYRLDNTSGNWTSVTNDGSIRYVSGGGWSNTYHDIYLRYSRNQYDISYNDGIFVDGQGNPVLDAPAARTNFATKQDVYYEANINTAEYNTTPALNGYVFLGWYDNALCAGEPYAFDKMPAHNMALYAKWGIREYEVNLHANDSTSDPIKYNNPEQATTFYPVEGDKIGNVGGERIYYDLVGWYTDEAMTHVFNFDSFVLNQTMVEKYGKIYSAEEIDPKYPTTVGEINLYAKWRSHLIGADGINVEYDANGGTNAPEDDLNYVDGAKAIAGSASTPADAENYVFSHWNVMKWNGTEYVETGVKAFPGDTFDVIAANAKITDKDGNAVAASDLDSDETYTYTVQLKAVYIEKDKETLTFINWYDNYTGGKVATSENIKINEATPIPAAPTRAGYEFKGWIRGIEEDGTTTKLTDLWLTYKNGEYTYEGEKATHVAADENLVGDGTQHHALYAKWEAINVDYTVEFYYQNDNGEGYTEDTSLKATRQAKTDSTVNATDADKAQTKNDKYVLVAEEPSVLSATVAGDGSTVLKLYFNLNKVDVTVEHYLKGQTTAFKIEQVKDQIVGEKYSATPETKYQEKTLTVDSYDPSQEITVATTGNLIKIYYTLPLTITAKTESKTYDGQPLNGAYTIEGALDADKEAIEKAVGDAPSITNVSESPKEYKAETKDIPSYYEVTNTQGTLTINPAKVTITAKSEEFTYDGEEHSNDGYDVTGLVGDDKINAAVTGTITFPSESPVTNEVKSYEFTTGNAKNYTVETKNGQLTMKKAEVAITIKAADDEQVYNGNVLKNKEVTVTQGTLLTGDELVAEANGSATNVADTKQGNNPVAEGYKIMHGDEDVTENYKITTEAGTLTINPAEVTITAQDKAFAYSGEPKTWPEYDVTGLVGGDEIEATVTGTITFPSESPVTNKVESYKFTKGEAGNYTVKTQDGKLTMTNASVEITIKAADETKNYDGKALTNNEVKVTDGELLAGDKLVATANGSATNVSDTKEGNNPIAEGYKIMHGTEDVTANYAITTVDGTLTITPRPVILTSGDAEKVYDGTPLTNKEVTAQGFVEGEGATYDVTGSQTEVGGEKGNNTFTYTLKEGTKAENYTIQTVEGTLTVKPVTNKVTVTITENSGSEKYDGSEKTVTGYTVSIDNELYTENDFEFSGDATVKGTDAGSYEMELMAEDFNNISDNFTNVEFVIVDGTLEISKRTVTLTSADDEKVYDGTELTNDEITVGGDGFAEGEGATYDVTGTQTNAGNSTNTFEYTLNEGTKAENYEITKTEGTLTVTPVKDEVVVTITGNKDEVTYNGKEQSVEGYTVVEISNDLYKEVDFAFSGNDKVSAKNANDEPYMMGLKDADFENISKNFTNVTFKVTDGELKINKLAITIETGSDEKAYDGKELVKYDDLKVTVTEDEKYEGTDPEKNEYSFTLSTGDKLTVTITGTQTYVGSSDNTCGYAFEAGKESAAEPGYKKSALLKNTAVKLKDAKEAVNEGTVDNNYDVTVNTGTLTVTDDVDPSDVVTKKHEGGEETKFNTGDVVTFTITVTNIYDEDKDITLVEKEGVELAKSEFNGVKPGETVTTTATYTITEADVLAGFFKNTVTAKFSGIDKPYPGEDEVPTVDPNPSIHVFKTTTSTPADGKAYKLGETIEYTIQVANDGNVTLTDIVATDELTGDEWKIGTLAHGESKEFTAKHAVTEEDVRNGKVVNVATATGNGPTDKDPDVIPGTTEDPTEESKSHITIEKTITNKPANGKAYRDGETIEYKIVATNDGNQTMKDITVKDELTGDEWKIETLAPGESKEFTAKYTVTKDDAKKGSVVNTATGEGTSENPDDKPEVTPGTAEAKTETTPDPTPVPKTGDKTSMGLWVSMMAAALAGFGGTLIKRKKEEA